MAEFKNNYSWSFSRHKTFNECLRKYYWNYYGSWNGWNPDGNEDAIIAYRLKNIHSMPVWIGDLVHRMVERILSDLQNQQLNALENYQKQLRGWMNKEWKQSVEQSWKAKPKWNLNLFEHYYGVHLSAEQRVAARDKAFRCLRNLIHSAQFEELESLKPKQWKSLEKLDQFPIMGLPVWVKIDLATQPNTQTVNIYDWKTGKENEDIRWQLGCYALFAHQVWSIAPEHLKLITMYIDHDKTQERCPSAEELIETKDYILESMKKMTDMLDSSVEENKVNKENFPKTNDRYKCKNCNFRELCFKTREWKSEFLEV